MQISCIMTMMMTYVYVPRVDGEVVLQRVAPQHEVHRERRSTPHRHQAHQEGQ